MARKGGRERHQQPRQERQKLLLIAEHLKKAGSMEVGSVSYYQIVDAVKALYQIEYLSLAIEQLTMTNLRNVMGELTLDHTLTSRETVNVKLRTVLDEATGKWGVR